MSVDNIYDDNQKAFLLTKVMECTYKCPSLTKRNSKEVQSWLDKNQLYYQMGSGEIIAWIVREPLSKAVVELKALYVLPGFRNIGVAYNLIKAASKENRVSYLCATRTPETHNILRQSGFMETKLLTLPLATLFYYLISRKLISISGFLGNKTTFWYKNAI